MPVSVVLFLERERYDNRTIYDYKNYNKRTDESFRNQEQSQHHTRTSLLITIRQLNMVTHFVLDFMHLFRYNEKISGLLVER